MRVYREEFNIGQHLQNLRKVYLFEASDLMYAFYSNLFKLVRKTLFIINGLLLICFFFITD